MRQFCPFLFFASPFLKMYVFERAYLSLSFTVLNCIFQNFKQSEKKTPPYVFPATSIISHRSTFHVFSYSHPTSAPTFLTRVSRDLPPQRVSLGGSPSPSRLDPPFLETSSTLYVLFFADLPPPGCNPDRTTRDNTVLEPRR